MYLSTQEIYLFAGHLKSIDSLDDSQEEKPNTVSCSVYVMDIFIGGEIMFLKLALTLNMLLFADRRIYISECFENYHCQCITLYTIQKYIKQITLHITVYHRV